MKFCPMCGMPQLKAGLTACQFCHYEEKPLRELSKSQVHDLMGAYEYKKNEDDTLTIVAVKNIRDISLRGAVAIPHFVSQIEAEAFAHCKFLARVELPKMLRTIGDGAFMHCRDLFDIYIPESVTQMGKGVFAECYDLGVISCAAPAKPAGWDDQWLDGCDARVEWSATDED